MHYGDHGHFNSRENRFRIFFTLTVWEYLYESQIFEDRLPPSQTCSDFYSLLRCFSK